MLAMTGGSLHVPSMPEHITAVPPRACVLPPVGKVGRLLCWNLGGSLSTGKSGDVLTSSVKI